MKTNLHGNWKLVAATIVVVFLVALVWFWKPARETLTALLEPHAVAAAPQAASGESKILYYEDPMHPWYRSDKPGIAPDCGMKLVPVYAEESGKSAAPTMPGGVQISAARQQLLGLTTAKAEYRPLEKVVRTVGRVELDEERIANVHVKVSGWIQKVFVDYTFQHVMKGDPLFTLYSPELLASEQEYLLALKAEKELGASSLADVAAGGKSLKEAARRRLELWDLTDEQIRELEETGKPQREITFYAPASGHVLERKAFPNQYITPDTELYKIADHSEVWVVADIYEAEMPALQLGQEVALTADSLPGQTLKGYVVFIPPHLMAETRTLPVRMEFPNPELQLKPEMFVNVELRRSLGRQLVVPVDAVLDSGERQRVFVARADGVFEPREVKLGERTEDYVAIVKGLRAGEKVVTRANFLVDSESNLRQAIAGMADISTEGHGGKAPAQQAAPSGHEGHDMTQPAESRPQEHHH